MSYINWPNVNIYNITAKRYCHHTTISSPKFYSAFNSEVMHLFIIMVGKDDDGVVVADTDE